MKQKIIQIGNSSGIIIPKSILKATKLKIGEELIVEGIPSRNAILVRRKTKISEDIPSLTLEFFIMLEDFNKSHADVLRALAKR